MKKTNCFINKMTWNNKEEEKSKKGRNILFNNNINNKYIYMYYMKYVYTKTLGIFFFIFK